MDVKDVIDDKLVLTKTQCQSKGEMFQLLANKLAEEGYITDQQGFVDDIYLREAEGKTGIGNYVAIPHSKSTYVQKPGVAIAINDREIPWESLDDRGARAIILFAVGADTAGAQEHLRLLALFAKKLGNDQVVTDLLQAEKVADVIQAFR